MEYIGTVDVDVVNTIILNRVKFFLTLTPFSDSIINIPDYVKNFEGITIRLIADIVRSKPFLKKSVFDQIVNLIKKGGPEKIYYWHLWKEIL